MRNDEIIKKLNKFKEIEPDPGFAKTSKALILSHKPLGVISVLNLPFLRLVGAFVVLILAVAALTLEIATPRPVLSASFNPTDLKKELEGLTINVQIEEVEYRQGANQTIASALVEVEDTNIRHLNSSLLEGEAEAINLEDSTDPRIDELLNKVIF